MDSASNLSPDNPYEPDASLKQRAVQVNTSWWVEKLRKRKWLSWILPASGFCVWFVCYQFPEQVKFWLFEVPNFGPPRHDHFMDFATLIAGIFWGCGGLHQMMMMAFRKQLPGVLAHLITGLLLSAGMATGFLFSLRETTQAIREYPIERRGPPPWIDRTESPSPALPPQA
jgi:hypothetical protein